MPEVRIVLSETEDGTTLRETRLPCDFLPRVGDTINCFDIWDDLEIEGFHFGIVYEIDWSIDDRRLVPTIKVVCYNDVDRLKLLQRRKWVG